MKNMKQFALFKTIFLWLGILVVALTLFTVVGSKTTVKKISYSEFIQQVKDKKVTEVVFNENRLITGKFKEKTEKGEDRFETFGDISNPALYKLLVDNGITPNYSEPKKPSIFFNLLLSIVPVLLIGWLFIFALSRSSKGGNPFTKNLARLVSETDIKITFDDVAGAEESKEELVEIVDFLKNPNKFHRLGAEIPRGVLLVGPPGTGKTLLAKAVAGEAGVPFFSISGSAFVEMYVGVGSARVRSLFEEAKKSRPCIIFIDEIDALGKQRGMGLSSNEERENTLNQLLVEMDGFDTNYGVIVIAATNREDVLDKALLRPGRFDRIVHVSNPDVKGREEILKVHTISLPLSDDVNLNKIARGTSGFSGAELKNLVNEAALLAAKENKKEIFMSHFERAKDKLIMGVEKKSMKMNEKERVLTAYHEAGHTIVGLAMEHVDPIHKVSIVPRGRALGVTVTLPNEDKFSLSKNKINDNIAFLLGGRVAEEIILKDVSTGASNDIERATELARRMICNWGMNDELGPINYNSNKKSTHSQETLDKIDKEIQKVIENNNVRARKILKKNIKKLHKLAKALLDKETIDAKQLEAIMRKR